MALVITMLAAAVLIGATTKHVGLEVYAGLWAIAAVVSTGFMFLYFRLFL